MVYVFTMKQRSAISALTFFACWCALAPHAECKGIPPEAFAAWEALARRFDVTILKQTESKEAGGELYTETTTFKSLGENRVVISETSSSRTYDAEAWGRNERYLFRLKRSKPNGQWVLAGRYKPGSDVSKQVERRLLLADLARKGYSTSLNHIPILNLVSHSSFSITEQAPTRQDGKQLFEFDFQVDPRAEFAPGVSFQFESGHVVLDKDRSWLPVDCRLKWPSGDTMMIKRGEFDEVNGLVIPQIMEISIVRANGQRLVTSKCPLEKIAIGEVIPAEQFTLTAFGVPEPGTSSASTLRYSWVITLGIILILAGLILRRRALSRA